MGADVYGGEEEVGRKGARGGGVGSGNISTGSDGGDMPAGCGVTSCCMISDAGSPRTEGLARLGQAQSPPGADSEALPPPPNSRKAHLSLN